MPKFPSHEEPKTVEASTTATTPSSGDLGIEKPVTEFDKTPLNQAPISGTPESPATLPENMPPLNLAEENAGKKVETIEEAVVDTTSNTTEPEVNNTEDADNKNWSKRLKITAAATVAGLLGVGGLALGISSNSKRDTSPKNKGAVSTETNSVSATTQTKEIKLAPPEFAIGELNEVSAKKILGVFLDNHDKYILSGNVDYLKANLGEDIFNSHPQYVQNQEQLYNDIHAMTERHNDTQPIYKTSVFKIESFNSATNTVKAVVLTKMRVKEMAEEVYTDESLWEFKLAPITISDQHSTRWGLISQDHIKTISLYTS